MCVNSAIYIRHTNFCEFLSLFKKCVANMAEHFLQHYLIRDRVINEAKEG
jgi:hypothetical protein